MKKITRNLLLILIMLIPVFFLSGCEDADWDLLEIFVQAWAEEEGLYKDGKYSPVPMVQKVAEDTIGDITHKKPFIELDGVDVLRDMEKADAIAKEALVTGDHNKMGVAINMRPNDWQLQEQDAVLWLNSDNSTAAQHAQDKSDDLLREHIQHGGNCVRLHIQQLEFRNDVLKRELYACNDSNDQCKTLEEAQLATQQELQEIYATNTSPFCDK